MIVYAVNENLKDSTDKTKQIICSAESNNKGYKAFRECVKTIIESGIDKYNNTTSYMTKEHFNSIN